MAQGSSCQTTRFALFYCALLFVFCSVQTLSAQEDDTRVVSGTVVNEKSEVVVGATVSAQSQHAQRTAITDNQGNFLLRMPVEAMTLTVSGPSIANFQQTLAASAPSQGLRLQIHYVIAKPPQLSGTVVDTSGAVIAGATVQVRSASGTVQITTQSDTNGSFIIFGLSAGNYRLVVSNPGFESKEIPVSFRELLLTRLARRLPGLPCRFEARAVLCK